VKRSNETFRDDWWWRKLKRNVVFDGTTRTVRAKTRRGQIWKKAIEPMAYAYELARRHDRSAKLPPYPKSKWIARLLKDFTKPDNSRAYRLHDLPIESDFSLWDDHNWGPLPVDWHYTASLESAVAAFKVLYVAEQKRRGIARNPRSQQGQRNRSVSWRGIELMDVAHFKGTPRFPASERTIVSRARLVSRKFFHYLVGQLTEV
jgi:hypothetical protein